jgi:dipeptidyl aminopeptidase/acylaminoacyl peptidase
MKSSLRRLSAVWIVLLLIVATAAWVGCAPAADRAKPSMSKPTTIAPALIPRRVLFGNPDKTGVMLSPDGARLSFLAPDENVLNVWVGPADNPAAAQPITHDRKRGIRGYFWAYTNAHIVYVQDEDGDENWRVYSVDVATKAVKDLTPLKGVRAEIEAVSHRFPNEILVGLNDRDAQFHDIYRVNLLTGERRLVQQNPGFAYFLTDDTYAIRFTGRITPDGGSEILRPAPDGQWQSFIKIGQEDSLTTNPAGFDKNATTLYLIDSRGRNTAALYALDLATGAKKLMAEDEKADITGALVHPTEKTIQAVASNYERQRVQILDPAVQPDFDYLRTVDDGDFEIISRTLDDKWAIVAYIKDNGPVRYYRYDRAQRKAQFLFTNRQALEGAPLARMHPVIITSRDGLPLVSYLTLPLKSAPAAATRPTQALPMVLMVHGGPWGRSAWGLNSMHQWFADRGYAVLDVNFRSSTGFGKSFANAGDREWAGKMHDDLVDAVRWAIAEKIADPQRVAIFGGSYGGYATLVGLTFTPDLFACGVDIVGPSSLITLIESVPPYWKPILDMFYTRVGDPRTEAGKQFLLSRSPLTFADRIKKPLLIGQGANDPRVKQAESDQIVKAMKAKGIPVTYILFPDEGHGFARPENRLSLSGRGDGTRRQ